MRAVQKQFVILMLLLSWGSAQDLGEVFIQDILVSNDGKDLRVEILLSAPIGPVKPERRRRQIVVALPNTSYRAKRVEVNSQGVRAVRTRFDSQEGTSVVIDLDRNRPFSLTSGNKQIFVTFAGQATDNTASNTKKPVSVAPLAQTASAPNQAGASMAKASVPPNPPSPPGPARQAIPEQSAGKVTQQSQSLNTAVQPVAAGVAPDSNVTTGPAQDSPSSQASPPESDTVQPSISASTQGPALAIRAADPSLRTVFKVKYVAEGVAYLDGGRAAGLKEGVKLEVQETDLPARQGTVVDPSDPRVVAELEVTAVAESSAVTDIRSPKRPLKTGDLAYLSSVDAEALVQQNALSATRKYPAVVSFTEGDTLDEEVRDEIPRPPLPSVNRARGRIGFDYMGTVSHGSTSLMSSELGMVFRGDITRINGTFWDLSGFWRSSFTSQAPAGQATLQDLINRTYHLSMTYNNPNSDWVAGFGRLYLPWASSLDTIDGGYFGRKLSSITTVGLFGGSTPDPTSYDYAPGRVIGGGFINFEGGDYTKFHYSSTLGAGINMLNWQVNNPFGFVETTISYTQRFSIYDAAQVDSPYGNPAVPPAGVGLGRNFLTIRTMVHPRVELDFNHTYFRDIPTFDPTLIGTGLLDKYLFQGFSVGARVEVKKQIFVYTQLGRSNSSSDTKSSLNQLYGVTFNHLPWWGLRADVHYAQFSSAFGSGSYKSFSVSRNFTDNLRLEVLAGQQSFSSALTNITGSRFITGNVETNLGSRYFIQGGYTANRGQMNYDQWMVTLGFRFDSKARRRE